MIHARFDKVTVLNPAPARPALGLRALMTGYGIAAAVALGTGLAAGPAAGLLALWLGGAALGLGLAYLQAAPSPA